ncbi:Bgt-1606 [Blumeria graminis f. sp. tritici]|uniref:Bgt-1606 n=3 Tax=Blumeria graminis TaxID=34373 RepID=A0A9X9MM41_BLUGR|nr:hypothetical protein BGT96224_1606 [Blumeria graminis f. sp. tritici 96224]VDB92763.1 Bgt-1606 [Blumeria graminis f. sp. tritici]
MQPATDCLEPKLPPDEKKISNEVTEDEEELFKFSPEKEASLLEETNVLKLRANDLFAQNAFTQAIEIYDQAVSICPNYRHYEVSVLKSNTAACHLKIEKWKEAAKLATDSLERLEKLLKISGGREESASEPCSATRDAELTTLTHEPNVFSIERMKTKTMMRRARANSEVGGWAALQSAHDDYQNLSKMANLSSADRSVVQRQLVLLPPRIKAAQTKEMGDLMGQLKQLGNGILKPFGLSTDNFNVKKDEKTGSYSMDFKPGS